MVGVALLATACSVVATLASLTPFEVLYFAYPDLICFPMFLVVVFAWLLLWQGEPREVRAHAFLRGFVIAGSTATLVTIGFATLRKRSLSFFVFRLIDASPASVVILGHKFKDAFDFLIPVVFVPSLFLVAQGLLALAGGLFLRRRVDRRADE